MEAEQQSDRSGSALGRIVLAVLILLLAWSLVDSLQLARHVLALGRLDRGARGELAADQLRNPLVQAGRTRFRQRLAKAESNPGTPFIAGAWRWCYEGRSHLPQDARIYLNTPSPALYYYGNFFWHPARVEVSPERVLIAGEDDLAARARLLPPERFGYLGGLGYTHVIDRGASGRLAVTPLASGAAAP